MASRGAKRDKGHVKTCQSQKILEPGPPKFTKFTLSESAPIHELERMELDMHKRACSARVETMSGCMPDPACDKKTQPSKGQKATERSTCKLQAVKRMVATPPKEGTPIVCRT